MEKFYNVVCVTTHSYGGPSCWHLGVEGNWKIIVDTQEKTVVFANNKKLKLRMLGTRTGLDSMSHVVIIVPALRALDTWDLYTDTPAEGSNATPKEIRKNAKMKIQNRNHF